MQIERRDHRQLDRVQVEVRLEAFLVAACARPRQPLAAGGNEFEVDCTEQCPHLLGELLPFEFTPGGPLERAADEQPCDVLRGLHACGSLRGFRSTRETRMTPSRRGVSKPPSCSSSGMSW